MQQILVCILLFILSTAPSGATNVVGSVQNEHREPIPDVLVKDLYRKDTWTRTMADGSFRLAATGGSLLIEHPAYNPVFVLPAATRRPLRVVLQARTVAGWVIRPCKTGQQRTGPLKELVLQIPRGFKRHVDDHELLMLSPRDDPTAELRFWRRTVSTGVPSSWWFEPLVEVSGRAISLDEAPGYDIRGVTGEGKMSRWVGWIYTFIVYAEVAPPVAARFDAIIDQICYR